MRNRFVLFETPDVMSSHDGTHFFTSWCRGTHAMPLRMCGEAGHTIGTRLAHEHDMGC